MSKKVKSLGLSCVLLGGLLLASATNAETMLTPQELLAEPNAKAATTIKVKKGETVTVLQKKGFWVEVESPSGKGWTKLNTVKAASGTTGLVSAETGRLASGNIVSSSGVRGLDGGDLEQAKPDKKEFDKLATYAQSTEKAASFAKAGKLTTREMAYVQKGGKSQNKKDSKKSKKSKKKKK